MRGQLSEKDEKQILTDKLIKSISAYVEVEVSAFLDGVGTVQNKQNKTSRTSSKQAKIEEIKNKARKRFS